MNYKKELITVVISLIVFIIIGLFGRLNITGFTTVSQELSINLSKTNYTSNEKLQGSLKISLNSPLNKDSKIKIILENQTYEYLFTDILNKSRITYQISQPIEVASAQNTTKTLIFSGPSTQKIGLEIPANSTVTDINMKVGSSEKNNYFPSYSYIDVASDDIIEWHYFGNLVNYVNETYPSSLDLTREELEYINDNSTIYCNVLDLPYSRDFNFSVKYSKQSEGGDIKLLIMSCESCSGNSFTAYGGLDTCDLPESTASDWHSCALSFKNLGNPIPIKGKYLVCMHSPPPVAQSATLYSLITDKSSTNIAYKCDSSTLSNGQVICTKKSYNNYYMKVGTGNYSKTLDTQIQFSDWLTSYSFKSSLTDYLKTCIASGYYCVVPLKVGSDSEGILKFSDLSLNFIKPDGISSGTSQFTDITTTEGNLYKINNIDLTTNRTNITISLSIFNITVPNPETSDIYSLAISLGSAIDNKYITVTSTATPSNLDSLQYEIKTSKETLQSTLSNPKSQEILDYLNLKTALTNTLSTLNSYETELLALKTSNLTAEQKQLKIDLISSTYNTIKKDVIEIKIKGEVTSKLKIEPFDIKDIMLAKDQIKDEVFSLQDSFVIASTLKSFQIIRDASIEERTIITKNIKSNAPTSEVYIVEEIPKQIASKLSDIEFKDKNYEIIENDPIVRFYFKTLNTADISYIVNKDLSSISAEPKTIIVPKTEKSTQLWTCGDNKCTVPYEDKIICPEDCKGKVPYVWITIIAIIAALAIAFLAFSKKIKFAKKEILSKGDFETLKAYIQNSLKQGIKKDQLSQILLNKGWKKEQINYVFKKIKI